MPQTAPQINFEQIKKALPQLTPEQREELEQKIWAMGMDEIVREFRNNIKKNKITQKEINTMCEEVRQELYEKRQHCA